MSSITSNFHACGAKKATTEMSPDRTEPWPNQRMQRTRSGRLRPPSRAANGRRLACSGVAEFEWRSPENFLNRRR
jgi:hypothetical protein